MKKINKIIQRMNKKANLIDNIYKTLEKKGFDTSFINKLKDNYFNDKQISYLTSIKYGINGQQQMDEEDWNKLVSLIYADLSVEQIKMITKLIIRGRSDEQIELVEKYDLNPEEIAIVDQNFFDTNESLEQAETWIKRYLF